MPAKTPVVVVEQTAQRESRKPKTLQRRNRGGSRYLYHEGKGSRVAASMGVREENKPRANRRITHMGENKPLLLEI